MKNSIKFFSVMVMAFMLSSMFIACEKNEQESSTSIAEEDISLEKEYNLEQGDPNQKGEETTVTYLGRELQVEKIGEHYIFEGDMIIDPDDMTKSTGRTLGSTRWPNNIVYYEIQEGFPNEQRISDAIANWEANTALRFVERTDQDDYIFFQRSTVCNSFVGRTGGRQIINLADGCTTGSTIHEIGHAVGLWHEQSRKDRDEYVIINFENIEEGREFNFETYLEQGFDGDEFTDELDFNSIMMYGPTFFSKDDVSPTITRLDGSLYEFQRTALSPGDIEGINKMYPATSGDICNGINQWSPDIIYQAGDQVVFEGNLWERTNTGWDFIGACGTAAKSSNSKFIDLNDVDRD